MLKITYPISIDPDGFPSTLDTTAIDLSENVLSWTPDIQSSWDWSITMANKLKLSYDRGIYTDSFFCDIELVLDYDKVNKVVDRWWKALELTTNRNRLCYAQTDLDLFFPDITWYDKDNPSQYSLMVVPESLIYNGKYYSEQSKEYSYTLRLKFSSIMPFSTTLTTPSFFSRGYWESNQEYAQSMRFNRGTLSYIGNSLHENFFEEQIVTFNFLSKYEANELLRWVLTKRSNDYLLTTSKINNQGRYDSRTSTYKLKDFEFQKHENGIAWNAELIFVDNDTYNFYKQ